MLLYTNENILKNITFHITHTRPVIYIVTLMSKCLVFHLIFKLSDKCFSNMNIRLIKVNKERRKFYLALFMNIIWYFECLF